MLKLLPYIVFIINCLFSITNVYAQTKLKENDAVSILFEKHFNKKQPDSIYYQLASEEFRTKISFEKFTTFYNQLLHTGERINQTNLIEYNQGVSKYIIQFNSDHRLFMFLGLDTNNKIRTLLFKPYIEPVEEKSYVVRSTNSLQSSFDCLIDTVIRQYIQKENTVGLRVGIIKNQEMYTYGYGSTRKGDNNIPTDSSLFEIGSITKTFTSLLLAYDIIKNKINIDDPILKYLPDTLSTNPVLEKITFRMLANHTSGLPRMPDNFNDKLIDTLNPYKYYDQKSLFSYLKIAASISEPGKEFLYSNVGISILGNILILLHNQQYEKMIRKIITDPLKMNNTIVNLTKKQREEMVATHNIKGEETSAWDFSAMAPAGGLKSTLYDLMLYVQAQMKPETDELSKAMHYTQQETFSQGPHIGLSWILKKEKTHTLYLHTGGTYGSSSFLAFIPEKQIAVVILSNGAANVEQIGTKLIDDIQCAH